MTFDYLLSIVMSTVLLGLAIYCVQATRSILHPVSFYCSIWAAYLLFHLFVAPDFRPCAAGTLWILVSSVLFILGAVGTRQLRPSDIQNLPPASVPRAPFQEHEIGRLCTLVIISSAVGLLYSAGTLVTGGFSLGVLFSSGEFTRTASDLSADRYSANPSQTIFWVQLTLIGVYTAPIWGGILKAVAKTPKSRFLAYFSLFPALVVAMTQTTRASIMFGCILWLAGYFTQKVANGKSDERLLSLGQWFATGMAAIGVFVLYSVGDVLRQGQVPSLENVIEVFPSSRIRASLFGSLNAFSIWLQDADNPQMYTPTFGVYTFGGLAELLGFRVRESGLYGEDSIEVLPGTHVNIFTVQRGIIQDVTLYGAALFFIVLGAFSSRIFRRVASGDRRKVWILVAFYGFASSCLTSIMTYNSILIALLLTSAYSRLFKLETSAHPPSRREFQDSIDPKTTTAIRRPVD